MNKCYKIINTNWSLKREKDIIQFGMQCQAYSILHQKTSTINSILDTSLGVISGAISGITAALIVIPGFAQCSRGEHETIIYAGFLFLSTFLTFLQQGLSLKTKSKDNFYYSKKYQVLYSKIKLQMTLDKKDREDAKKLITELAETLNKYILEQPEINSFVSLNFQKKFKTYNIFITPGAKLDTFSEHIGSEKEQRKTSDTSDTSDTNDTSDTSDSDMINRRLKTYNATRKSSLIPLYDFRLDTIKIEK